ncbi:hypothetical protein BDF14DRAFT_1864531 [Spinellus fusiger]|nr:hypothetical protein BDF14DRAFT_1864531 [Spinellus fusiger]
MASLLFEDYAFPHELYDKDTGDFTAPIQTLVHFTPHILRELPKKQEDQVPLEPPSSRGAKTMFDFTNIPLQQHVSKLNVDRVRVVGEFLLKCAKIYLDQSFNKPEEEEKKKEEKKKTEEEERKKLKEKENSSRGVYITSAAAAGALTLSVYSTYKASSALGDISFHDQLEVLLTHVQSILNSTNAWRKEREKLGHSVPDQIKKEAHQIQQLVDSIARLDPRLEKRTEAAGWGMGAVGGLSALGGIAMGSTAILTGGATIAVGSVLFSVAMMAKSSSQATQGARRVLEDKARSSLKTLEQTHTQRLSMLCDLSANALVETPFSSFSSSFPAVPASCPSVQPQRQAMRE